MNAPRLARATLPATALNVLVVDENAALRQTAQAMLATAD